MFLLCNCLEFRPLVDDPTSNKRYPFSLKNGPQMAALCLGLYVENNETILWDGNTYRLHFKESLIQIKRISGLKSPSTQRN